MYYTNTVRLGLYGFLDLDQYSGAHGSQSSTVISQYAEYICLNLCDRLLDVNFESWCGGGEVVTVYVLHQHSSAWVSMDS